VRQDYRQGIFAFAPFVNEMNTEIVNFGAEMREAIDSIFLRSPVESRRPVIHELFQVVQARSVIPSSAFDTNDPTNAG
jgi:hypothetical protein